MPSKITNDLDRLPIMVRGQGHEKLQKIAISIAEKSQSESMKV